MNEGGVAASLGMEHKARQEKEEEEEERKIPQKTIN
jgi:hypothetical protein